MGMVQSRQRIKFTERMPNFSLKAAKYDIASEPQAELASGLFELSLDYLPDTPPVLLDIGCGTGHLSLELASLCPKSLDCLDVSKEMLEMCKEKLQANFPNLKWRLFENDAENFEPDIKYDAIYSSATIQWFNDLPEFLAKARKWLNPNGIFCIGAFGEKTLCELRDAYFEATGRNMETKAKFLSLNKLAEIFKKEDFALQETAESIYVQSFENSVAALKGLRNMGVTGTGAKALNRTEAQKLIEILPANFSWELIAMIFRAKETRL
jgi:malonyl-CoA O-methyltransferase